MKRILYIFLTLFGFISCSKNSVNPSYSFSTVMDSLGLQFGKQYAYQHYTDSTIFETGYITFNSDSSFIEIMNTDTFYYHATIIYTYNPKSYTFAVPSNDTIQGEQSGLKYTYYYKVKSSTALYPGDAYLAWCCYRSDSIKGNPNHYLPLAYYLQKFTPVFMGIAGSGVRISPAETLDSMGFPVPVYDKIILIK